MEERNLSRKDVVDLIESCSKKQNIHLSEFDVSVFLSGAVWPGVNMFFILGRALNLNPVYFVKYDSINPNTRKPVRNQTIIKNAMSKGFKYLYVLLSASGLVKIGISENINRRIKEIENSSGHRIIDSFVTAKTENAQEIESLIHFHFDEHRRCGEWFDIDFREAVNVTAFAYRRFEYSDEKGR